VDKIDSAPGPASSARLSLEISELVSRALSGGAVDIPTEGEKLSERYRELGMSGEMIGNAIVRALGMVGAIRDVAERAAPPVAGLADVVAVEAADACPAGTPDRSETASELAAPAAELAASVSAIDSSIVLKQAAPMPPDEQPATENGVEAGAFSQPGPILARFSKGPVAVVRRALFRQ
jgi:hypothetical protein